MTKFTTHLVVVFLGLLCLTTMWGCSELGPTAASSDAEDYYPSAGRGFSQAEGGWATVELVPYNPRSEERPTGELKYRLSALGVFEGQVQLSGLRPEYEYLLAIIGKPTLPGRPDEYYRAGVVFYDDDAPEPYTGRATMPGGLLRGKEFCNFALVISDPDGYAELIFEAALPAGHYDVCFAVKDAHAWAHHAATGNFKTTVLKYDEIEFQITTELEQKAQ